MYITCPNFFFKKKAREVGFFEGFLEFSHYLGFSVDPSPIYIVSVGFYLKQDIMIIQVTNLGAETLDLNKLIRC